ncbi:glutaredoxin family protein [Coralloluteibacterium stylophorae]|uniref:Glutaredoxin family protein n=1 Tax=Coralloluteibacterium stylophorae TaxID=1776034 RepID=A0A8J7VYW4_9GAMM|nr:glutaredoxin family protein [Coralloluteibacterium stylophorae]MBS7456551.1 glutaredoxin family protein [Coralloluteibacterium stylophorae]
MPILRILAAALVAAALAWGGCGAASAHVEDAAGLDADDPRVGLHDDEIVLIAADWCGFCQRQVQDFERGGVRYRLLDYDTAAGRNAARALGLRGVPITVIGRDVVQGYRPDQLGPRLAPLGYDIY